MTTFELIIILAMTGYAVYQQTRSQVINGASRFKTAIIYAIIGACVGLAFPHTAAALGFVAASLAISLVVGYLRGTRTQLWTGADGQMMSRGTPLTITLFLALIASKFALATIAYIVGVPYDASMGEVLVMIAISIAVQAEVVWRRAQRHRVAAEMAEATRPGVSLVTAGR